MSETTLTRAIAAALRKEGAWVVKTHGGPLSAGVPDLLVCYKGRFVAVEVKMPGGRLTRLQASTLGRISVAGGWAIVATSVEDAMSTLGEFRGEGTMKAREGRRSND